MAAAAASGVTRLACPPDTDPVLDEPGLVEMPTHRARLPEFADVHPVAAETIALATILYLAREIGVRFM